VSANLWGSSISSPSSASCLNTEYVIETTSPRLQRGMYVRIPCTWGTTGIKPRNPNLVEFKLILTVGSPLDKCMLRGMWRELILTTMVCVGCVAVEQSIRKNRFRIIISGIPHPYVLILTYIQPTIYTSYPAAFNLYPPPPTAPSSLHKDTQAPISPILSHFLSKLHVRCPSLQLHPMPSLDLLPKNLINQPLLL